MGASWDRGSSLLAAGVLVVAILAGIWFGAGDGAGSAEAAVARPQVVDPPATSGLIVVHVSGWVESPGLVRVPADSRVADAVAAAGGARPGADLARLNLAERVVDGQQVVVAPLGRPEDGPAPGSGSGKVRLNQAAASDLESLPGVGPVLAERIVAYRQEHGPFQAAEDLLGVSGIGEHKLESLRDLIQVP